MRFKLALLITTSYVVIYQIQIVTSGLIPLNEKILSSIGLWVVLLSSTVGGYLLESLWRRNYLQNLKIEEQQKLLVQEQEKSEKLLLNTLPENIAERLKNQEEPIADYHVNVSVLFADIVNFTPLSQQLSAEEVVNFLNETFSIFDSLVDKYQLEKIKTIGDAYMVVAGIPPGERNPTRDIMDFAMDIMREVKLFKDRDIKLRIGIHTGPVVAGVIGKKKFLFDLWGDTVNTASRMETYGLPDCIQITEETFEIIKDIYPFRERGIIDVKGKGKMKTYIYNPNQTHSKKAVKL